MAWGSVFGAPRSVPSYWVLLAVVVAICVMCGGVQITTPVMERANFRFPARALDP